MSGCELVHVSVCVYVTTWKGGDVYNAHMHWPTVAYLTSRERQGDIERETDREAVGSSAPDIA